MIKGEFGNGIDRKNNLGELYAIVQNKVNEMLGCSTRIEIKSLPNYVIIN